MTEPKRILIFTADVGFGHRSAANAIAAALNEKYGQDCQVEIVNPLDDRRTPAILRDSQSDYDRMVRQMPEFYKLRYQISDTAIPSSIMQSAFTVMLYPIVDDLVKRFRPDVVVTTHPMFPAPLSGVIAIGKENIPLMTVVTDLTAVHRLWFNDGAELIFVPTEDARQSAIENGIPEDRIRMTGIPVNPMFARRNQSPVALRARLGWKTGMTTALVVGSKRVNHLKEVLHVLNHSGFPLQWVIVAGGDDELYQWMQETEWHGTVHRYNYVENLAQMMCAADLVLSKAGGLIVTESLACGLPMLLIDVTPGQEEGNANYVIENGAAEWARSPLETLEILCHWLDHDQALLARRSEAASRLGRPGAAYAVAETIWEAAQRGPLSFPDARMKLVPKLMDLLTQFGLAVETGPRRDRPQSV